MTLLTSAQDVNEYRRLFRQCRGKKQFSSRNEARQWANSHGYGSQRPYFCDRCGFWHLTSKGVKKND